MWPAPQAMRLLAGGNTVSCIQYRNLQGMAMPLYAHWVDGGSYSV